MAEIEKNILKAVSVLLQNELVAIPTETVYGLAANALEEKAVAKIFAVKNRPTNNPLIIHISDKQELDRYVTLLSPVAERLAERFWPGPLTLLLPKKDIIPSIVTASLPHVAVRVPDHPLTLELIKALNFPLAAPSANPFGYISPTTPEHVQRQIGHKIRYILDGGACKQGVESTIVGFEGDTPIVYRLGAITIEELKEVAGTIKLHKKISDRLEAPGMLPYHYAPQTPFYLTDDVEAELKRFDPRATGIITFQEPMATICKDHQIVLSPSGDIQEAARNLYNALHQLDALNLQAIIAERFADTGLGQTLNDRLERAAKRSMTSSA